jgi:cytochrome c-type biogenesis protein CcmH/NrfG
LVARVLAVAGIALALVMAGREGWSQHRLNQAEAAYRAGHCGEVAARALDSLSAVPTRAEPYQLIGYCDLRVGASSDAVQAFRLGLERDPRNWELNYALAVGRAATGANPARATRRTVELNPQETIVRNLRVAFSPRHRRQWMTLAGKLPLPPP